MRVGEMAQKDQLSGCTRICTLGSALGLFVMVMISGCDRAANDGGAGANGEVPVPGESVDDRTVRSAPQDSAQAVIPVAIQLSADPNIEESLVGYQPNLDMVFTNQDGQPFPLRELMGTTVVLTTIYTACPYPDMCPRLTADIAWLATQVPEELEDSIRFVVLSFDPARDTPEVLRAYGLTYGIDFAYTDLIVGDIESTRRLLEDELQIPVDVDVMSNTITTHAMMIHIINPQGYIVVERTAGSSNVRELIAREMIRAATLPFDPNPSPVARAENADAAEGPKTQPGN